MVPQILSTLLTLYERPEQIVQHLIAKVRSTPAAKSESSKTLVSIGLVEQNLFGDLSAVELKGHLSQTAVKFNWALYQQQPVVDLNTFSDYMAKVI